MNSQWKLVPVEPTETMVINGFESEPNECFTDDEVWEQYQEMSGCQQAAFRAKLCWAAMLGSAPSAPTGGQPEVVAVIREEGEHFKETVVEYRPGIDRLPAGTELVDRAHVIRVQAERDALQLRLNEADQRIDELTAQHAPVAFPGYPSADPDRKQPFTEQFIEDHLGKKPVDTKIIGIERMPPMEYDEP